MRPQHLPMRLFSSSGLTGVQLSTLPSKYIARLGVERFFGCYCGKPAQYIYTSRGAVNLNAGYLTQDGLKPNTTNAVGLSFFGRF